MQTPEVGCFLQMPLKYQQSPLEMSWFPMGPHGPHVLVIFDPGNFDEQFNPSF
jgi:hypothetical protein